MDERAQGVLERRKRLGLLFQRHPRVVTAWARPEESPTPDRVRDVAPKPGITPEQLASVEERINAMKREIRNLKRSLVLMRKKIAEAVPNPMVDRIIRVVGQAYGVIPAEIRGPRRFAYIARARQVSMFLARELTDLSLPVIGLAFGGKDHSTVVNAIERVTARCEANPQFSAEVDNLRRILSGGGDA